MSDLFAEPSSKSRQVMPPEIHAAMKNLNRRLTKRERVLEATIITTTEASLDLAITRALVLACEGEIVQVVLGVHP